MTTRTFRPRALAGLVLSSLALGACGGHEPNSRRCLSNQVIRLFKWALPLRADGPHCWND